MVFGITRQDKLKLFTLQGPYGTLVRNGRALQGAYHHACRGSETLQGPYSTHEGGEKLSVGVLAGEREIFNRTRQKGLAVHRLARPYKTVRHIGL